MKIVQTNLALIQDDLKRNIACKESDLAKLHPDNYTAAMFLGEVEAALREAKIESLQRSIRELKRIQNAIVITAIAAKD